MRSRLRPLLGGGGGEESKEGARLELAPERERAKRIEERKLRQQAMKDYIQSAIVIDRLLLI